MKWMTTLKCTVRREYDHGTTVVKLVHEESLTFAPTPITQIFYFILFFFYIYDPRAKSLLNHKSCNYLYEQKY